MSNAPTVSLGKIIVAARDEYGQTVRKSIEIRTPVGPNGEPVDVVVHAFDMYGEPVKSEKPRTAKVSRKMAELYPEKYTPVSAKAG